MALAGVMTPPSVVGARALMRPLRGLRISVRASLSSRAVRFSAGFAELRSRPCAARRRPATGIPSRSGRAQFGFEQASLALSSASPVRRPTSPSRRAVVALQRTEALLVDEAFFEQRQHAFQFARGDLEFARARGQLVVGAAEIVGQLRTRWRSTLCSPSRAVRRAANSVRCASSMRMTAGRRGRGR